jgi:hypothetical protein
MAGGFFPPFVDSAQIAADVFFGSRGIELEIDRLP